MGEWDRFHRLAPSEKPGSLVVELPEEVLDVDAQAGLAVGEVDVDPPLRFAQIGGRRATDIVGASSGHVTLISARLREALEEGGFSGWRAVPAIVAMKGGEERDDYSVLVVEGRSGPIDKGLSERVELPPPVPEGVAMPGLRGLLFDPGSWDGSDVFAPEGTTLTLVTAPVAEAVAALKPTNVLLQPITEIEQIAW